MRVGVTAHDDQQGGVVDSPSLLLRQTQAVSQSERDHALAQRMLHGLAETEVDAERERRHQVGQPESDHVPTHGVSVWQAAAVVKRP